MISRIILIIFMMFLCLPVSATAQEDGQQFEGFNLQGYTENGEKAWDIKGDTAEIHGDVIEIFNVDANRYGEQEMNLKARNGTLDKITGNIHLEEDVIITTAIGGELRTDTLDWDKEKDLLETDDYVTITDERMVTTGTGLKARPGLKLAELQKDVTVKVKTQPQEPGGGILTISCDGPMEIDHAASMAIFNKNVVAVQSDKILKADQMKVYFDPDAKKIDRVICLGNVEIFQGENKTYSEKAIYTGKDQKVVLSGRPKLIMITEGKGKMGGAF